MYLRIGCPQLSGGCHRSSKLESLTVARLGGSGRAGSSLGVGAGGGRKMWFPCFPSGMDDPREDAAEGEWSAPMAFSEADSREPEARPPAEAPEKNLEDPGCAAASCLSAEAGIEDSIQLWCQAWCGCGWAGEGG